MAFFDDQADASLNNDEPMAPTPYRTTNRRMMKDMAELAELEALRSGEPVVEDAPEPVVEDEPVEPVAQDEPEDDGVRPLDPEEATFKQRYGDLRRHVQALSNKHRMELDALRAELDEVKANAAMAALPLPKSEAELAQFYQDFPDAAAIFDTIVAKRVSEHLAGLKAEQDKKFKEVEDLKAQSVREKAEAILMKLHPDLDDIRNDVAFHEWAKRQPDGIQAGIYRNNNDPYTAARIIDLYKADIGAMKKPAAKDEAKKDAARSVRVPSAAEPPTAQKRVFRESEIDRMSERDYLALEAEIDKARREGRIVMDVSSAR